MERFTELIKIFLEKHLIPTVISFVTAAIIFAFTPEDFWLIDKFTKTGYFFFLAGVVFILIQLLIWIKNKMSEKAYLNYIRKSNAENTHKENMKAVESLWDFVDDLCDEDRNYLKTFLKSGNKPIVIRGNFHYPYGRLFNSEYVKKQKCSDQQGTYVKYVLDSNLYHDLKLSSEQFGKISHFEEV